MSKYAPTTLFCDNQGPISLAKNPIHHAKTKHVDVQLHFIRDQVEKGTMKVEYCPTDDMLADIITKGLARERLLRSLGLMGVGTREVTKTTTPSSPEAGGNDLKGHGDVATSGSVELRGSHAVQHSDMDAR
jgi:hypothetical protein